MKTPSVKLALIPLGLVLLALLPKLVAYLSLKNELDHTIKRAQPLVRVSYRSLSTGYDGSITLDGIKASLSQGSEPLRIDEIELTGDSFLFPLRMADIAASHEFPSRLRLRIVGMEIPDLGKLRPPGAAVTSPGLARLQQRTHVTPCSFTDIRQYVGFQHAILTPGRLDLDISYRYDRDAETMEANYSVSRAGIGSLSVLGRISRLPNPPDLTFRVKPALESAEVHHQIDSAYLRDKLLSCAEAAHESPADFVAALILGPDSALARETGWVPNDSLARALAGYLLAPGEITINLHPAPYLLTLPGPPSRPQDWVQLLGMSLSIKGEPVQDLSMRPRGQAASQRAAGGTSPPRPAVSKDEVGARTLTFGYTEVPRRTLDRYIGRAVRVLTRTHAKALTGILKKANANEAQIDNRVLGGHITMYVKLTNMTRAEVYLRSDELDDVPR